MEELKTQDLTRVVVAGLTGAFADEATKTRYFREVKALVESAGGMPVASLEQTRENPDPRYYFGEGKVEELMQVVREHEADLVVISEEIKPMQLRFLNDHLPVPVIDRTALILDIFAQRARSHEGKLQVELAQLRYQMPRLRRDGVDYSRQGGGIGTRGPGETKLETDRRKIRDRIADIRNHLYEVRQQRSLLRRSRAETPVGSLVGYTNAGKSSLLELLTGEQLGSRDQLFATLDPTLRGITTEEYPTVYLSDTVGFVEALPPTLLEAFMATLEEVSLADFLLHVVDVSSNEYEQDIAAVNAVLQRLNASEKLSLLIFNKVDLLSPEARASLPMGGNIVHFSAKTGEGKQELLAGIDHLLHARKVALHVYVPFSDGKSWSLIREHGSVSDEEYDENGVWISATMDKIWAGRIKERLGVPDASFQN